MSEAKVEFEITSQPIPSFPKPAEGCGAVVEFRGLVRGEENGESIRALEYSAYEAMAGREVKRLIRELLAQFPCTSVRVVHRIGVIPVGETAIALQVAARHRAEAFSLAGVFMDRLKQDVPIWKIRANPK